MVLDVNLCGVKLFMKEISPAPEAFVASATAILDGGVADQKNGGFLFDYGGCGANAEQYEEERSFHFRKLKGTCLLLFPQFLK